MKNRIGRFVLIVLGLAVATAFTGCVSTDQDSAIPFGKPQSWEGQQPAFGGP